MVFLELRRDSRVSTWEAPIPDGTALGDGAFRELVKVKW